MNFINEEVSLGSFEFLESDKSEVDGVNVLGRVRGTGFIVEGASRNKRWYSRQLWESQLKQIQPRIENRQMLGYFGHESSNTDDNLGNAALIVTSMEIPKSGSDGIIEYIIPATEAGQNLNALLRAGSKLSVSTRATGTTKGKDKSGNEVLDPSTYKLHSVDIVANPGVARATPTLVENLGDIPDNMEKNMTDITLKKEEYEALLTAKASLEAKLESTAVAGARVTELEEELAATKEKLGEASASVAELKEAADASVEAVAEKDETIATYEALGTADQISNIFDVVEEYQKLGTVEQIAEAFDAIEASLESEETGAKESAAKAFAEEHGVDEAIAIKLLDKFDADEAAELASTMGKTSLSESYRKHSEDEHHEAKKAHSAAYLID